MGRKSKPASEIIIYGYNKGTDSDNETSFTYAEDEKKYWSFDNDLKFK